MERYLTLYMKRMAGYPKQQLYFNTMNALRTARAAARLRSTGTRLPLQRRGYADPVSDKIKLTLALPHQVRFSSPRFTWRWFHV